jgi:hypothetical protein
VRGIVTVLELREFSQLGKDGREEIAPRQSRILSWSMVFTNVVSVEFTKRGRDSRPRSNG